MPGDDAERRSSDRQMVLLQQKLVNHIEEYKARCDADEKRWDHLIVAQEKNTEMIKELTNSTRDLTESTRDIVNAWQAANGTVKTMSMVGQFVKWLSGFAVIGVAVTWVFDHFS